VTRRSLLWCESLRRKTIQFMVARLVCNHGTTVHYLYLSWYIMNCLYLSWHLYILNCLYLSWHLYILNCLYLSWHLYILNCFYLSWHYISLTVFICLELSRNLSD
jgi:hypothetical protein